MKQYSVIPGMQALLHLPDSIRGIRALFACIAAFSFATSAYAQPTLDIDPSYTSGVAPLLVFFDATATTGLAGGTNALANADFSWDFDTTNTDPDGSWEQAKGFVAAHVFEEPGTYTVRCTVADVNGNTDTDTVNITVSAFSGTTYYVAANGNNANPGTEGSPWLTRSYAMSQLSANERILFRRGDTFSGTGSPSGQSGGPMIIGAYGSGAAPVFNNILHANNMHNLRVMDLHIISGGFSSQDSTHVLALRLETEATADSSIYTDDTDLFGAFDCYLHNIGLWGTFSSDATRFAWVGNLIDYRDLSVTTDAEHGMRIQRGGKHFIAYNTLSRLNLCKTAITIRGDLQRYVVLYRNVMDRILQVNPTNSGEDQFISDVLIEGNYVGQNDDYENDGDWTGDNTGINVKATRVVVRNNVTDGYVRSVQVNTDPPIEEGVSYVDVYHNTAHWRPNFEASGSNGKTVVIGSSSDVTNVTVRNNMISATSTSSISVGASSDSGRNIVVSNNLVTASPAYVTNPLPNSAAHVNSPFNYQLLDTSPAIDAAEDDVPVFYDLAGVARPVNGDWDFGAFEYTTGNNAPVASLSASVTSGTAPLAVDFDASGSSDPDEDELDFEWDFDDGNGFVAGDDLEEVTFTTAGIYDVVVRVSDGSLTDTDTVQIEVAEASSEFVFLQLEITGTIGDQTRLVEVDWIQSPTEYPTPHFTGASGYVTHTGNSGWEAYDGDTSNSSLWNTNALTGTLTLELASGTLSPESLRLRSVNSNRAPSGFIARGSENGTDWVVLTTVSGLTSTDWSTAGNDITFPLSY